MLSLLNSSQSNTIFKIYYSQIISRNPNQIESMQPGGIPISPVARNQERYLFRPFVDFFILVQSVSSG